MEQGLTQTQLAEKFSINFRTICNWEKGLREPSLEMLVRLAAYFNVTTDYLLGVSDA